MDLEEAMDAVVSKAEAVAEIRRHHQDLAKDLVQAVHAASRDEVFISPE
jgi:hypothetical protein